MPVHKGATLLLLLLTRRGTPFLLLLYLSVLQDTILSPDFTGKSTILSGGGSGGSDSSGCVLGGVSVLTGDYTVQATDGGKLLVFNSSGPATVTLLNPPSSDKWCVELQDIG